MQEQVCLKQKQYVKHLEENCFFMLFLNFPYKGAHSWGGAGCAREAGASRNASSAQKASRSVPHDENGFAPCE